jgi:mono/diheme cytochrome c family protein
MIKIRIAFAISASLTLAAAVAGAQPKSNSIAAGQQIATRWCSQCHLVGPEQMRASDAVPTFAAIANKPTTTAASLRAFLQAPHWASRMPDLHLTRAEIDDVTAYILSLRKPSP